MRCAAIAPTQALLSDPLCDLYIVPWCLAGIVCIAATTRSLASAAAEAWAHPSGIVPGLQNVVATVDLGCKLDLVAIAQKARNAEYNPKRFAACIIRIREPKTTALLFNSGKMVIAGAKSEEQARLAARKVAICSAFSQLFPQLIVPRAA